MTPIAEALKKAEPIIVSVTTKVTVDPEWVAFCTEYNDLLMTTYCGYWARGVYFDKTGWLVWEFDNDERNHIGANEDKLHKNALAAFKASPTAPLPKHYHRLDRDAAIRAWVKGCETWGIDWYEHADANSYDYVIQMTLLGEERYA